MNTKKSVGEGIAGEVLDALERYPSVFSVQRHYLWGSIKTDLDDNKFADCAIACGADCLVTKDKHFNILRKINFPRVPVVTPEEFKNLLTRTR